jgi:hypothetical protein
LTGDLAGKSNGKAKIIVMLFDLDYNLGFYRVGDETILVRQVMNFFHLLFRRYLLPGKSYLRAKNDLRYCQAPSAFCSMKPDALSTQSRQYHLCGNG